METSLLTFVLLALALWMLQRGLLALKGISHKKSREEAERIFRQRVIAGEKKAIVDLLNYFRMIRTKICVSIGYFLMAYIMVFTSFFTMKNSDTPSPLWQLALFAFALFLIPLAIVATASFEFRSLRDDILGRFRPTGRE
ncbi:MAG TPA: hypothetical protein VJ046_02575 [Candidatus Paceibacterota bacterium]|nr:hypothetical protein [Candidatus Paceibacterota bacterium]